MFPNPATMAPGIIMSQTDPETVFNTLCLAHYSLGQGETVRIFLSGSGVEIDRIEDLKFDVRIHRMDSHIPLHFPMGQRRPSAPTRRHACPPGPSLQLAAVIERLPRPCRAGQ
jgi:hypothetical protein